VIIPSPEANFTIQSVFTSILEPYPFQILQSDKQKVLFRVNQYFSSPYFTERQVTTIRLASHMVDSFTQAEPFSLRSSVLKYGPYNEKPPYAVSVICFECAM
jgi:oligosaccharyltransferase complex subunit alpha (ribophorin I)